MSQELSLKNKRIKASGCRKDRLKTTGCKDDRLIIGKGTAWSDGEGKIHHGTYKLMKVLTMAETEYVVCKAEWHNAYRGEDGKIVKRETEPEVKRDGGERLN